MPGLDTYLTFNGNCADAIRFYETTLGAKVDFMMTFGESPMAEQTPPEIRKQIMHSSVMIGERRLMASDNMPGAPYNGMSGFTLSLIYKSAAEGEKIFNALAAGGKVVMPYQETFWAERWGALVDKFGTPWMVNAGHDKMAALG